MRLVAHLRDRQPQVIHNHMYRAEVVGTRAALALSEAGLPRPYVIGTVHSSRIRSDVRPGPAPRPDAAHGPPHRGQPGDRPRSSSPRAGPAHRSSSSTTAWTSRATTTRRPAARCRRSTASRPARRWSASSPASSPRRATRPSSRPGRRVLARVPAARLLIVGEGTRRDALEAQAEELGLLGQPCEGDTCVGTRHARPGGDRRLHRPARRRARRDRGARRGRAALLPRGARAGRARGDGAQPAGRGHERRRHPGDGRARAHGAAGAAARRGRPGGRHRAHAAGPSRSPTRWPAPRTTWSTSASASNA